MSRTIKIRILGRDYSLRSQQSEEQVKRISEFIDKMLAETIAGRTVDTRDAAALALLNLAGQYLQLLDQHNQQDGDDSRLQAIVMQLEHELSCCEKH